MASSGVTSSLTFSSTTVSSGVSSLSSESTVGADTMRGLKSTRASEGSGLGTGRRGFCRAPMVFRRESSAGETVRLVGLISSAGVVELAIATCAISLRVWTV